MFFCQNCNNSLDITKNANVKKVDKIVINTPEEFIKSYNNTITQNYYLNFNEDSLKLYLKKEDIRKEDYTNIINSFYKILKFVSCTKIYCCDFLPRVRCCLLHYNMHRNVYDECH